MLQPEQVSIISSRSHRRQMAEALLPIKHPLQWQLFLQGNRNCFSWLHLLRCWTYSIRACADKSSSGSSGTIFESNETDNCSAWTNVTVGLPPLPDLVANAPSPVNAVVNTSVTFSSVIQNIGNAGTGASFYNIFQVNRKEVQLVIFHQAP